MVSCAQVHENKRYIETTLANIEQKMSKLPKPDKTTASLRQAFIQEIQSIASHSNPKVTSDINYVLVLSGRSSYLKNPVDRPDIADREDDYNRMRLGINVARSVTALRLGKDAKDLTNADIEKSGPTFIYNRIQSITRILKKRLRK